MLKNMFQKAWDIISGDNIKFEYENELMGESVMIKGKTDSYVCRIYRKATSWFQQCGCKVGVSNKPQGLCKHSIANIVRRFLKENSLKIVKIEEEKNVE